MYMERQSDIYSGFSDISNNQRYQKFKFLYKNFKLVISEIILWYQ